MSDWIETFKGAVLASEYDAESHMNTQMYVSRFDQATWFLLNAVGITPSTMKKQGRRIAIVRQRFQYIRELTGGELVVVQSGIVAVGQKHIRFLHRMLDIENGKMIATSDYTAVLASLKSGQSVKLPANYKAAAEDLLVTANVAEDTGLS